LNSGYSERGFLFAWCGAYPDRIEIFYYNS
jgi:hypothetical protein